MKIFFTLLLLGLSYVAFAQVNVSFIVTAINQDGVAVDTTNGVFIVGDVNNWVFDAMEDLGDHVYIFDMALQPGDTLSYACNLVSSWDSLGNEDWNYWKRYKEPFDSASLADCTPSYAKWEGDRWMIVPENDTIIEFSWGVLCSGSQTNYAQLVNSLEINVFPNPTRGALNIQVPQITGQTSIEIFNVSCNLITRQVISSNKLSLDLAGYPAGIYTVRVSNGLMVSRRKLIIGSNW